jgi:hypothetical protein
MSSSGGFAAFAGSTSPFASLNSNKFQQTAFNSSKPIWNTPTSAQTLNHTNELGLSESTSIEAFKSIKDAESPEVKWAKSKYTR